MREVRDIKEIKQRLLAAAIELRNICEENSLQLFMGGGTLLGAVRHKGFIPWDDDIDFYMRRDDYDKLIRIMQLSNSTSRYKLYCHELNKDYNYPYAKYVDTSSILYEKGCNCGVELGLYVDIFPIDGLGNTYSEAKKQMRKMFLYNSLIVSLSIDLWRKEASLAKNLAVFMLKIVALCYGKDRLYRKISKIAHDCPYRNSAYVGQYMEATGDKRIFNKESVYSRLIPMQFEGEKFLGMENFDLYLKQTYGDYMTLPPPEKQINTHGYRLLIKEQE